MYFSIKHTGIVMKFAIEIKKGMVFDIDIIQYSKNCILCMCECLI